MTGLLPLALSGPACAAACWCAASASPAIQASILRRFALIRRGARSVMIVGGAFLRETCATLGTLQVGR